MKSTGRLIAALTVVFGIAGSHVALRGQTPALFSGISNGSVSAYTIGGAGLLTAVAGSPFAATNNPRGVAIDPTGQFLYATISNTITGFRIGPTGILTAAPGSPCATGSTPTALVVDASGKFVYAANSGTNTISACAIGASGNLTALAGSPFATGSAPKGIVVDSTGQYLYVTSFNDNSVYGYSIAVDGTLSAMAGSPFSAGFQPIGIATSGTHLYVANNGSQSVSAFTIGAGGTLTEVGGPYLAALGPYGLTIPAGGAYLYVTNQITQAICAFTIAGGGGLSTVGGSPYATPYVPAAITSDPSGQFVYVTSQSTSQMSGYSVGAGGVLTPLAGSPFTTPGTSVSIASRTLDENQATHFSVTLPATITSYGNHQITVQALDQSNNPATGYNGTVTFTSTDPGWSQPADLTLVNGFGFANTSLKTAGSQTVTATDTLVPSITGSATGTVDPGPLNRLAVAGPSPVTAGVPFNVTVRATDLFGNTRSDYTGTVHLGSTDAAATIPGDSTLINGEKVFSFTLRTTTSSAQHITATDAANSLTGNYGLSVNPGPVTHFDVTAVSPVTSGNPGSITVTARDAFENRVPGYAGTVHFTSSDPLAVPPANLTFIPAVHNGAAPTLGTLKTAGSQTWTATDTVSASITGTSPAITVNHGPATHFSVSAPGAATAGSAFNFTVTALDAAGNTDTGYAGIVHYTSTDGQAVLPGNATLASGVGTLSATLKTAGSQTITATDTVTGSITGVSAGITVDAAAATHFTVSAPGTATANSAFNFTVTALDVFNNTATLYAGLVHFTSTDGLAVLPSNSSLTNGVGTLSATLKTASNQTITATDTVTGSITGISGTIVVGAAAATHFTVSAPGTATAGGAFNFTVTALDAANNTATSYGGLVHFTSTDGQAVLPSNSSLTNGVGILSATLKTAGNQTITATDTVSGSITGTSANVVVSAGPATHFTVSAPGAATAGSAFNFTVTAVDAFNNTATSYAGFVHFTSTDGQAVLPVNSSLTNGVGTLSATLKTAGNQSITATDTVTGSITGTSGTVAVSAATATHFTVSAPGAATANSAFNFTVTALDVFGNTAASYGGIVHFTSTDGQAVLPSNSSLTNGVGTLSATLKTAGNQTITATDTVTGSITGTSGTIVVGAGVATHFTVSAPGSATAGSAFNFTVTALDVANNTATSYAGFVHFTSTDGQAVLPSNSSLTNGVGTLSATLKTAGNQTITATDTVSGSITGTSANVVVSAGPATHFTVSAPGAATAGNAFNFTVTAVDAFNNTATSYAGFVHFTSTDGQAVLPGNSSLTNGVGTLSATLKTAGNRTITATDTVTGSITGTSGTVVVSAAAATHFTVSAPGSATSNVAFNFTVTALDDFNNTATTYAGIVHFTSSDGSASLPSNSSLTNGTGTFAATLRTTGTQSITATDTQNVSITGTANVVVITPPTIAKAFNPTSVPVGAPSTLTFTIVNANSGAALTGVGFSDTLPGGLLVTTPNGLAGSCGGGTITAVAGSSSIVLSGVTIPPSAFCSFSVQVTGTSVGAKVNTTSVVTSANGGAGNFATATLNVMLPPSIAKSFTPALQALGLPSTLTFTITDPAGNPIPLTGIGFTDTLPAGLVVASPNGLTGSCGGGTITAVAGSAAISLSGATLASGACTFSVQVVGTGPGAFVNTTGNVTSNESGPGNTATATMTVLSAASGLTPNSLGGAFVVRGAAGKIVYFDASYNKKYSFGTTGTGNGQFKPPSGVAVAPNGNILVTDAGNSRIVNFDSNATFRFNWGSPGVANGQLESPSGIAITSAGLVWVVDTLNNRVQVFDANGNYRFKFGTFGSGHGQLNAPSGIALLPNGNVAVTDTGNNRIQVFDGNGNYRYDFGTPGSGNGQFNIPAGVAVDAAGNFLVVDLGNHRIQLFDANGNYRSKFGTAGTGNGQFTNPTSVMVVPGTGYIWVLDEGNNRIQVFDNNGNYRLQFPAVP